MNDNQTPTTDMTMDEFVNKLIEEKNYAEMDDELHAQIVKDVKERLINTINAKVIARLTDEQLGEFEGILDRKAPSEEVQAFIKKCIPDSEEFLTQVFVDFRKSYLGFV